jgi:hypothetical protein
MMIVMKLFLVFAGVAGWLGAAQLQDIKTVYVFPMRNSLDQYLAGRLSEEHVFQVVANPKAADAVLTDHVDAAFDATLDKVLSEEKTKRDDDVRPTSSLSRGHGMVFLVNKQKQVVWSTYMPARDSTPKETEKAAKRSVERLKKALLPPVVTPSR